MPTPVIVLAGLAASVVAVTLIDLTRHDVRVLPKWAWGLIILVAFPFGVLAYLVMGRSRPGDDPPGDDSIVAWRVDMSGATTRPAARPGVRPAGPPLIVATGLSKWYGTAIALDRVDMQIPRGSTYGLIGPNGAGKTTIISVLAGLRRPTAGTVTLAVDRRKIAVLVDTPQFEPWLTAAEVVDLARHLTAPTLPRTRVEQALAEVDLGEARGPVGGFSRGMLQRLGLAACLVGDPALLILDEPCSALDPAGRREVLDLIGRLARTATVVLSTHILADVQQVCDTVAVVNRGRIRFEGAITNLLARSASVFALQVRPPATGLVDALRDRPWVTEVVEPAPGRIRLVVGDTARAERALPRLIADHRERLIALTPMTDLETAFLDLTS
jgi:ABC-2 type transport system ATP-binding protein